MNKISYTKKGHGKVIVLIHGWGMHKGIWAELEKQLVLNHCVYAIDLPGHGESSKVASDRFTLNDIAQQVASIIPANSTLIGWSMGAMVAIKIAVNFPQLVDRLISIAGTPKFTQCHDWECAMPVNVMKLFIYSLEKNVKDTLDRFIGIQVKASDTNRLLLKQLREISFQCAYPSKDVLDAGLIILQTDDLRKQLESMSCPSLWILGEYDTLVPVRISNYLSKLKNARIEIIKKAVHVPFISHTDEAVNMINQT